MVSFEVPCTISKRCLEEYADREERLSFKGICLNGVKQ